MRMMSPAAWFSVAPLAELTTFKFAPLPHGFAVCCRLTPLTRLGFASKQLFNHFPVRQQRNRPALEIDKLQVGRCPGGGRASPAGRWG